MHLLQRKCKSNSQWDNNSHSLGWLLLKKIENKKCWKGCGEIGTDMHWLSESSSTATVENNLTVPKKLNIELPYDSAIPLMGTYPKELKAEQILACQCS